MRIWTENSLYELDEDAQTLTRLTLAHELRRDDEPVRCVAVFLVAVGGPAAFLVDVRGDGVLTLRTTSDVVAVE